MSQELEARARAAIEAVGILRDAVHLATRLVDTTYAELKALCDAAIWGVRPETHGYDDVAAVIREIRQRIAGRPRCDDGGMAETDGLVELVDELRAAIESLEPQP